MTATTSSIRSGLAASSHPQRSISAALARQLHVGVGEIPNLCSRRESSVPGPEAGGMGSESASREIRG